MARKRHTAEEIVAKLRQVDVLMAQGRLVANLQNQPPITGHSVRQVPSQGHRLYFDQHLFQVIPWSDVTSFPTTVQMKIVNTGRRIGAG